MARAREHTDDVEFSPQDATRTPLDFMLEVLQAAVDAGATTLNIPDTVGYGIPWDFGALIQYVRREVKGDYVTSTHCHNDLGLAMANSLAGVQAGARQVEVCVNGLGERAGNAALEEVVMALKIRPDQFDGLETGVRTEELARTQPPGQPPHRLPDPVQQGGRRAQRLRPRVRHPPARRAGRAHDLRDHRRLVGGPDRQPDRAGQALGPPRLRRHAAASMGITIHGDALNAAFARFKELADRKVQITDADLEAIVAEELGTSVEQAFSLEALEVSGGTVGVPRARVVLGRARREAGGVERGRRHDRRRLPGHQGRHRASTAGSPTSTSRRSPAGSTPSAT